MLNNWTIRQRILGSFAGILIMVFVMGGLSYQSLQRSQRDALVIQLDSAPSIIFSNRLLSNLLENYGRLQRHRLLTTANDLEKNNSDILATRASTLSAMDEYEKLISEVQDRTNFTEFKIALGPYWDGQNRILREKTATESKDTHLFFENEIDPAFEKVRALARKMSDYNAAKTVATAETINQSIVSALHLFLAGSVVIFIFALVAGYLLQAAVLQPLKQLIAALAVMRQGDFTERMPVLRKDEFGNVSEGFNRMTDELAALVSQVQKSGLQVTSSVTEIAATAKQQQATAAAIATTTAEIGATSKEITATSRQLVVTMRGVTSVADESAVLASSGQVGLAAMGDTMRQVMDATKTINTKLVILSEKASNINVVIATISKVAEQTNLLSLNAAIEAEKAGEHGRGFSVVATEIRRLADQTAIATHDIGLTVKEIQMAVSSSVMGMDKFSDEVRRGIEEVQQISGQLAQIIDNVQTLAPRVEDVNEGMQGQATSAEQITESLVLLNESAQQTVESLRQSSMAIDDLNQVANGLRGGVSRFKLKA